MKHPETLLKQRVLATLRGEPWLWCEKIQQVTINGTPDILGCARGRFFAWELKSGDGRPTKLQSLKLAQIQGAGGIARVVNEVNLPEALEELRVICRSEE